MDDSEGSTSRWDWKFLSERGSGIGSGMGSGMTKFISNGNKEVANTVYG